MIVPVRFLRAVCMSSVAALAVIGTAFAAEPSSSNKKVCIAHAGASQYAPAHTLAAYALALKMGADYVEPDLQLTKDGVLICIHDATLERCTNAEDVFPSRHRTVERDGASVRTWPVVDFTLEEIRQLDAGSWFDPSFADQRVVTFQESLDLIKGKAGIYPEIKVSEYLDESATDLDIGAEVHRVLTHNGLNTPQGQRETPVVIQCFHPEVLRRLRKLSGDAYQLNQLVWTTQIDELLTPDGIAEVAEYAHVLGPTVAMVLEQPSKIENARQHGLLVHPWFLNKKLPARFDDRSSYYKYLLQEVGLDGLFVDDPDKFPRRPAANVSAH